MFRPLTFVKTDTEAPGLTHRALMHFRWSELHKSGLVHRGEVFQMIFRLWSFLIQMGGNLPMAAGTTEQIAKLEKLRQPTPQSDASVGQLDFLDTVAAVAAASKKSPSGVNHSALPSLQQVESGKAQSKETGEKSGGGGLAVGSRGLPKTKSNLSAITKEDKDDVSQVSKEDATDNMKVGAEAVVNLMHFCP